MGCGSSVGIVVVAFSMVAMTAVVVEADDGHTSTGSWCIARSESTDKSLQTALDYVCGAGADCLPIQQNGLCYLPNTLQAHASYAFNSYYQKSNYAPGACDFAATATITITNPSYGSCTYPSSPRSAGGGDVINPPPRPTVVSTAPLTNSTNGRVFGPVTTDTSGSGSAIKSRRNSLVLLFLLLSFYFGSWD
ncbi:hypothetical protein ZOSMA_42G00690 [Zostera marina]|uniref:X8 domain-containing protein n=1 Tax=Zostera marina TaxID=29655 RepID=A0A0K9P227_ZOSMR|nr:hypothetical protein ZOSMA_42G00690 [Zostera marina]